jgi:hypothetical protein
VKARVHVEVRRGGGPVTRHDVDGAEVVVGSASSADICIDAPEEVAGHHLLLVPGWIRGYWVSVSKAAQTPVRIGHEVIENRWVPWGTALRLGEITIRPRRRQPDRLRDAWRVAVAAVIAVGALGVAWSYFEVKAGVVGESPVPHPPLFTPLLDCPHPETPLASAARAEAKAWLQEERYPYDPREGVRAVKSYTEATNCYEQTGRAAESSRTRSRSSALTTRVATDYATSRLRLESALEGGHWMDALRAARRLQLLTSHIEGHRYVEWLEEIAGKATARLARSR